MITLFEKFNWWKKVKELDVIDTSKFYNFEKPLNTFINELDDKLNSLQIQRAVCKFINDKMVNNPLVVFNAVKVSTGRGFPYDLCLNNKEWYDEHKKEFSYPFAANLNPMKNKIYLLTMTIRKEGFDEFDRGWKIQSFLIHLEDLKNMLVNEEIKYNRITSIEDPYGEEDW